MERPKQRFWEMKRFWAVLLVVFIGCFAAVAYAGRDFITVGKTPYVSLSEVGRGVGLRLEVVKHLSINRLAGKSGKALFEVHKRDVNLNGTRVYLGDPVTLHGHQLYISQSDYEKTVKPLLAPTSCRSSFPSTPKRIVIDAGHGGGDPGAENKAFGLKEKNLTLDLAARLKALLTAKGFEVVLTRSQDVFVPLANRPAVAVRYKADLFISLHFNAAEAKEVTGIETYALTPVGQPSSGRAHLEPADFKANVGNAFDVPSACLAFSVQTALLKGTAARDRGFKRARFLVLRELPCPGILVEGGFVSSDTEATHLKSEAYRNTLAEGIAAGICSYATGVGTHL